MSVRLLAVNSYVNAVKRSGLKNRSEVDYFNCLKSKLYHIQGDKVVFRTYMNDLEYWEYAFSRVKPGQIEYLYTTYGCEN